VHVQPQSDGKVDAMIETYYNQLAPFYRYLFPDWENSVTRQAQVLDSLIQGTFGPQARRILDAACGIGTQCIGLAQLGYQVVASDISTAELELARQEAARRSLSLQFIPADMRNLRQAHQGVFDVVLALDNSIPHLLSEADILLAFQQFYACTGDEGGCLISVRDYANMELDGKRMYPRTVHQTPEGRIILFDIWDFDGPYYDFTTYIVEDQSDRGVRTHAIRGGRYYCVTIATLKRLLKQAGFSPVIIEREKFYQPVLVGLKRNSENHA
jgi:SAM-dependent methyltransferase